MQQRTVTVVMPTHMWCFRDMLRGIGAFANARATWKVQYLTPRDNFVEIIRQFKPNGLLLGDVSNDKLARKASKLAPVTVDVFGRNQYFVSPIAAVISAQMTLAGEMIAEYFLQKGYTHFAMVGYGSFSEDRFAGFEQRLAKAGHTPARLLPDWEPVSTGRGWRRSYPSSELTPFIRSQPKPLALMAYNDIRGREIVEACKADGIRVPEDVAIMGVDNDLLECGLSHPALSSVNIPWHRLGYLAATQLDHLLEGQPCDPHTVVPPTGIVERQSTDTIAISDADVSSALRYIRQHAHVPFGVDDVVDAVVVGRRTLEKRFTTLLGRTLLEEIRRVRIERAQDLLAQTDLSVGEIAERCGFPELSWFSTSFRQTTGTTPAAYRKRFRVAHS